MELAEADVEAKIHGKVFVGEYYTSGYITASKKSDYLTNKRLCMIELTLTSDDPSWYNEETFVFPVGGVEPEPDEPSTGDDDFEGIIPEGTLDIKANGKYDATRYEIVNVKVPLVVSHDRNGNVTLEVATLDSDNDGNVSVT
jgi:hypothetical protein